MKKEILSCEDGGPTPPCGFPNNSWYVGLYDEQGTIAGQFYKTEKEARDVFSRLTSKEG